MTIKKTLLIAVAIFVIVYVLLHVKTNSVKILGYYELAACERCDYFTVNKSSDKNIVNTSVDIVGEKSKIEKLVENSLESKDKLVCFEARHFLMDIPFNFVETPIKKLELSKILAPNDCSEL